MKSFIEDLDEGSKTSDCNSEEMLEFDLLSQNCPKKNTLNISKSHQTLLEIPNFQKN